jgi:hypothetical protein
MLRSDGHVCGVGADSLAGVYSGDTPPQQFINYPPNSTVQTSTSVMMRRELGDLCGGEALEEKGVPDSTRRRCSIPGRRIRVGYWRCSQGQKQKYPAAFRFYIEK